jgi:hypothetical protein
VVQAIKEFDSRRRDGFLRHYGYGPSLKYRLRYRGRFYDSKAIAGVAWGLQHFGDGTRRPNSYTGGAHTSVAALRQLGFQVVEDEENPSLPVLQPGRNYSWEELGSLFDFPPSYLSLAGGMISRPELGALLLITHSQDGGSFSYGDEWRGKELIYAGRGLTGHQELKGQNRQVAENTRTLFLFEHGGTHQLLFHGRVHCVDHWESTGFDKNNKERRVYRFRLRGVGQVLKPAARPRNRKAAPPTDTDSPVKERAASSFRSRPFDPDRTVTERRRSAPADPESQQVLSEQADQAHQDTLRAFGRWLEDEGWRDLEEIDGAIDLHAMPPQGIGDGKRTLFEIKSIRPATERSRVRGGLAQLLEYRLLLGDPSEPLCLVSDRPISERRLRLLDSLAIGHVYVEAGTIVPSGTDATRLLFPRNG